MLNGLDLFSGIGGIAWALKPWVRPYAYCEREPYAQGVLLSRMADRSLPAAPIWDDVRTLRADHFNLPIDIVSGGFPCQDLSVAGTGAGLEGSRSGLVFDMLRLIGELGPKFVFMENVPALAVRGLDRLLLELDALGYDARWTVISAAEVGAPHLRERIWILAHANRARVRVESKPEPRGSGTPEPIPDGPKESLAHSDRVRERQPPVSRDCERLRTGISGEDVADGDGESVEGQREVAKRIREEQPEPWDGGWWAAEPDVDRVVNGLPNRVDRIKGLGNAVVPQAAREAFRRLMGLR
jgi:DNA (cytosine-5)-methyltransferase 1